MPASALSLSLSEWLSSAPHTPFSNGWDLGTTPDREASFLMRSPRLHSDSSNPRASVTYTCMNGVLSLEEDSIWLMQ